MEIVQIIKDVGFPIAVCVYLLYRDGTTIKSLAESINNNTLALTKLIDRLDNIGLTEGD